MNQITLIGLDLAKRNFHIVGVDQRGAKILSLKLTRQKLLEFFAGADRSITVAMEACASCHYWGQVLTGLGYKVIVLKARDVKPYAGARQKNDTHDALAITKAAWDPNLRHVHIKTQAEQDLHLLHHMRETTIWERVRKTNRLMAILLEYGVDPGVSKLKFIQQMRAIVSKVHEDGFLSAFAFELMQPLMADVEALMRQEKAIDQKIVDLNKDSPKAQILMSIPGIGPINASVLSSMAMESYQRPKDFAASLGLVPRQHSTGGRIVLGSITRSRMMRTLLIQGARCLLMRAIKVDHPTSVLLSRAKELHERLGFNKASVAIANKLARIAHACATRGTPFVAA